jgi:hypothetical protein
VQVTIRYFSGCPNRRLAEARVRQALEDLGLPDARIVLERVETRDEARRLAFPGSPTVLVDGEDPFANGGADAGLACRVFATPDGPQGAPTVDQLRVALAR